MPLYPSVNVTNLPQLREYICILVDLSNHLLKDNQLICCREGLVNQRASPHRTLSITAHRRYWISGIGMSECGTRGLPINLAFGAGGEDHLAPVWIRLAWLLPWVPNRPPYLRNNNVLLLSIKMYFFYLFSKGQPV